VWTTHVTAAVPDHTVNQLVLDAANQQAFSLVCAAVTACAQLCALSGLTPLAGRCVALIAWLRDARLPVRTLLSGPSIACLAAWPQFGTYLGFPRNRVERLDMSIWLWGTLTTTGSESSYSWTLFVCSLCRSSVVFALPFSMSVFRSLAMPVLLPSERFGFASIHSCCPCRADPDQPPDDLYPAACTIFNTSE
jgi:hypothetical protein